MGETACTAKLTSFNNFQSFVHDRTWQLSPQLLIHGTVLLVSFTQDIFGVTLMPEGTSLGSPWHQTGHLQGQLGAGLSELKRTQNNDVVSDSLRLQCSVIQSCGQCFTTECSTPQHKPVVGAALTENTGQCFTLTAIHSKYNAVNAMLSSVPHIDCITWQIQSCTHCTCCNTWQIKSCGQCFTDCNTVWWSVVRYNVNIIWSSVVTYNVNAIWSSVVRYNVNAIWSVVRYNVSAIWWSVVRCNVNAIWWSVVRYNLVHMTVRLPRGDHLQLTGH